MNQDYRWIMVAHDLRQLEEHYQAALRQRGHEGDDDLERESSMRAHSSAPHARAVWTGNIEAAEAAHAAAWRAWDRGEGDIDALGEALRALHPVGPEGSEDVW